MQHPHVHTCVRIAIISVDIDKYLNVARLARAILLTQPVSACLTQLHKCFSCELKPVICYNLL